MASGDIAVNFDDIKSKPCNTTEVHAKSECKYKRRKLTKDGNTIYMWYRICVCKKYANRRQEYKEYKDRTPDTEDGVYVHEKSCIYKIHTVREKPGVKYYKIEVQCCCLGKPEHGR
uniref:Uncharacterized protein n=1 Tax=Magallana gigas TaxID=29159 RepID=K1QDX2_MAGGI